MTDGTTDLKGDSVTMEDIGANVSWVFGRRRWIWSVTCNLGSE